MNEQEFVVNKVGKNDKNCENKWAKFENIGKQSWKKKLKQFVNVGNRKTLEKVGKQVGRQVGNFDKKNKLETS